MKETVKETVIVEGTPQIVEKEVTKIVASAPLIEKVVETRIVEKEVARIVEKVVTATPTPTTRP